MLTPEHRRDALIHTLWDSASADLLALDGSLLQMYVLGCRSDRADHLVRAVASSADLVHDGRGITDMVKEVSGGGTVSHGAVLDGRVLQVIYTRFYGHTAIDMDISVDPDEVSQRKAGRSAAEPWLARFCRLGYALADAGEAAHVVLSRSEPEPGSPDPSNWRSPHWIIWPLPQA